MEAFRALGDSHHPLHNIPEDLAVGVAASGLPSATLEGALALALGIVLRNFFEGAAVSVPLRREGLSRRRSFFAGQASGLIEPAFAPVGCASVMTAQPILPYALASRPAR